ncbi:MAG: DeoR/GlpR transcriptional regulator [Erysipelotrichia bacterium]|nr:DeoR/GlpR transcriptional regulator [Erysipelotrichia bacterium]NCC54158.1 DeoR/GlpR transcriptional regulator [Erysipelotrichia bacterium]
MIEGEYMSKNNDNRRNEITKLVLTKGKVRVEELVNLLNVTAETIRSDLSFLEAKGILYRTHGGATSRNTNIDVPMEIRIKEEMEIKRQLSYQAINFIKDDDIIFIDPSSTAIPLGRILCLRKNLTIVTNSFELIPVLAESEHKIIVLGGTYSKLGKRTYGGYALELLGSIYFDVAIMGMDGCKHIDGPSTSSLEETAINRLVLKRCKKNILMSSASKFNKSSSFQYARFEDFDILITSTLSKQDKERIPISTIIETNVDEDI